jgi:peptidoglycan/xylan/chitin deacetylase (PgdA/CDA1 family)
MIQELKASSLSVLKQLGVSDWVADSMWRRRRKLILEFHGISHNDEHVWSPGLYISLRHFERRLALLKAAECAVLPLEDAVERLYRGDLPDRAVVLTFDDGYYDFLTGAWPLLQEYGYPATVYLTTARVDHNLPNVGLLASYALWRARDRELAGDGIYGLHGTYPLVTSTQRDAVVRQINDGLLNSPDYGKDAVVEALVRRLGLDYDELVERRVLTLLRPDEVARLSHDGVDFQLHTHLHRTPPDVGEFVADVLKNRDRIEAFTGKRPHHLCYPSGNYRVEYFAALQRHGVVSATTCDPGLATRTSHPLLLPRFVDTGMVNDVVFEGWLTGMAPCLPRRTRRGGYPRPN